MKKGPLSLALLGAGNMGTALLKRWIEAGVVAPGRVHATTAGPARRAALRRGLKIAAVDGDNAGAAAGARVVVLGVKPQVLPDVLEEIRGHVAHGPLVISIAAGVTTRFIERRLGPLPVIRAMPNTPARTGEGATAFCGGRWAGPAHLCMARRLFDAVGVGLAVPERHMDAVTALSGSGPAYVFYLTEVLADAGRALGLAAGHARALARQTVWGAGALLRKSGESPEILRRRVTSPGGATEAALRALEKRGLRSIFVSALAAARRRARELSR
jgi:pyrroline-5-carboxylate reductase